MSKPARAKQNRPLTRLIEKLALENNLTVAQYLRLKTIQALQIENHLGPDEWKELLLTIENARILKASLKKKIALLK